MRIVSLLPSATEILFELGLGDDVVGVTFECDFPDEARSKRIVSTSALPEDLTPAEIDAVVKERMAAGEDLYRLDRGAFAAHLAGDRTVCLPVERRRRTNVLASQSSAMPLWRVPCTDGYRMVSIEHRFGWHNGLATKAFLNRMLCAASASSAGVCTVGLPPKSRWSGRCWSVTIRSTLGRVTFPR